MTLSEQELAFVAAHQAAAMITVGADGFAKPARVGVGVIDGKLWSSGTADRVRTKRLRKDPRATLFVYDGAGFSWLGLDCVVTILDGPDAPQLNLRMMRVMQGRPTGPLSWFDGDLEEAEFLERMVAEHRLVYEFEVQRSYGPA